jgi:threonine dehydrogenase-like Zn-dependent dehydrogenase
LESVFATPHPIGVDEQGRHLFRAGIQPDGRTCVIGSGTVSMIYAKLAKHEGARDVTMLVRSESKAALVRRVMGNGFGVLVTGDTDGLPLTEKLSAEGRLVERLKEATGGELYDDVVCACADPDAQRIMPQLYAPEGYAVGACFGGTRELADRVDMDLHHYRAAKTIGTSGCSTDAMKTILQWLGDGSLKLDGVTDPRHWTFADNPAEFMTISSSLKPVLFPWEKH